MLRALAEVDQGCVSVVRDERRRKGCLLCFVVLVGWLCLMVQSNDVVCLSGLTTEGVSEEMDGE